jgi:GNAT superfamily N-acetyltransferase
MSEEFRAIRASELEECLDLWGDVFAVGRGYFPSYFYGDPWYKRAYTRVALADGKIVSAIQICERRVRVGEAEIIMGGIGNVATYPDFRGRGYSQRLLWDCAKVMHDRRIDLSVLFTGIQPFYEKALWRSVPQRMFVGKPRLCIPPVDPKYRVRAWDWDKDMQAVQRVSDAFNAGRPLTTLRTPEYWAGYLPQRFGNPDSRFVAEFGGEVVGYMYVNRDADNCWLQEIGYLSEHKACADVLLFTAAGLAKDVGSQNIRGNLPHEPEILAAIDKIADKVEPIEPMGGMFRVTNMHSLSERLLPELNRRAKRSPDGAISLDTELGSLRFTVSNGRVTPIARNPIRVPVSQLEFFCLLFGIKGAGELGMSIPDGAAGIINAIFPRQHPVFWGPDHF